MPVQCSSVYDRFPGIEPLLSHLGALDHDCSHRCTGFKAIIAQLKEPTTLGKAVVHWLEVVFCLPARGEHKPLEVDDHALFIFAKFQWELRKGRSQAINYISEVCQQLGYVPPEEYILIETSPNEQSVDPMIIDSHSCHLNLEESSTLVDGINHIRQVGETVFHHRSKPSDKQDPVLANVPTGVSNTSPLYSSTVDSCRMVSDVHTTSDSAPTCNIGPDTYMATCLDSSIFKNESEHSRRPPERLNTSLSYLNQSLPSHSEQYPAAIKREYVTVDNWLWPHHDFPGDAIEEEEPTGFDESQQSLRIDRPKVPLPYLPPIWAQSRQEICESFGWFRSYQSGVYHTREIVKGYLLGGFSASRDRFEHDGRLIISHGGGKAACLLQQKGQTLKTAEDDQLAQDKSVRALLRTYKECRPIVLVIDERYALFPFDLSAKGVSYAILGFYTIAHAWAEYQPAQNEQGRVVRYKFAFRWCEGQGEPWWIPSHRAKALTPTRPKPATPSRRGPVKLTEQALTDIKASIPLHIYSLCPRCGEKSPQVYVQGWACLVPNCPNFCTTTNHQTLFDCLDYDPKFLQLTKPFVLIEALVKSLRPSTPISAPDNGVVTSYASTKGWHCSQCGRLSCRDKWEKYECPNCRYSVNILGSTRSSAVLRKLHVPVPFQDHYYSKTSGVTFVGISYFRDEQSLGDVSCQTFALPYQRGFIHHIKAVHSDKQPDADEIFREYQDQALAGVLPFRRWPLRSHKCGYKSQCPIFISIMAHDISPPGRGSLLTNYFSQNSGVPYQYVGGTANTLPWDKAPGAVCQAREMIESRVSKALHWRVQFNEVLSAAYMERQRMSFHSDSEPGLGPLVAGLSLGSPALMHFRLLAKYEPIGEQRQIAMSFVLRHGDILVMDGAQVQEYYEHAVIPSNFRIAATARFINTDHT